MSEKKFKFTDELIQSYVDDELDTETRFIFEKNLKDNPEVKDQVDTYIAYNEDLRKVFNPVLEESIPEELLATVYPEKRQNYFAQSAVLVMTLGLGLLAGWFGNENLRSMEQLVQTNTGTLVTDAFAYHAVYTPEVLHPVEVTVDNKEHLFKWLSKRLSKPISAPSLEPMGYKLLGGRLLQTGEKPAAQFMYEDSLGQRLTLFARQRTETEAMSSFRYAKQGDQNGFYWMDENLSFILIGGVSKPELSKVAHSVYKSLNAFLL